MIQKYTLFIGFIGLLSITSMISGFGFGVFYERINSFPNFIPSPDINSKTATLELHEVKNNQIFGKLIGREARIILSPDRIISIQPNEGFVIPLSEITFKEWESMYMFPENALFIASKQGKYYYSIFDQKAYNLSANNRVFFKSKKEAEKMGYQKK